MTYDMPQDSLCENIVHKTVCPPEYDRTTAMHSQTEETPKKIWRSSSKQTNRLYRSQYFAALSGMK